MSERDWNTTVVGMRRFVLGGSVLVRSHEAEGRRHLVNVSADTNEAELHAPVAGVLRWPVEQLEGFYEEPEIPKWGFGAHLLLTGKEREGVVASYGFRGYDFAKRTLRVSLPSGKDAAVPWDSVHPAAAWIADEVAKLNALRERQVRAEHVARLCVCGSDGSLNDRELLRTLLDEERQAEQESNAAEAKSGWVRELKMGTMS